MPEILEYGRGGTAVVPAWRACATFSAACVPAVVVSATGAAWLATGGGEDFHRTLKVSIGWCGVAATGGLFVVWLAALLPSRVACVRGPVATAVAGVAHGVVPSITMWVAAAIGDPADWVGMTALLVSVVCLPALLALWLMPWERDESLTE